MRQIASDIDALPTRKPWDFVPTGWEIVLPVSEDGFDQRIHEIGNMIYNPWDTSSRRYKLCYSGRDTKTGSSYQEHVGLAVSPDGKTWTKAGHIDLRRGEDPYLVYDGEKFHIFCEDKQTGLTDNIRHYTSTDFATWTDEGVALDKGQSGTWDESDTSSPIVWIEEDTWYMLYEGRAPGNNGAIGLATSTDGGYTWSKHPSNPVAIPNSRYFNNPNPDVPNALALVPDDIVKRDGVYHMTIHASLWGGGFQPYRLISTDLVNWTPLPLDDRFRLPVLSDGTVMFGWIRGELHAVASRIEHGICISRLANPYLPWMEQITALDFPEQGAFATVSAGGSWTSRVVMAEGIVNVLIDTNRTVGLSMIVAVHLGGTQPWSNYLKLGDVEATRSGGSGLSSVRPVFVPNEIPLPRGEVRFRVDNRDANNPAEVRMWLIHEGRST